MLIPKKIEEKLGFNEVLDEISIHCHSGLGKSRAANLHFEPDAESLRSEFNLLSDFITLKQSGGVSFRELEGIIGILKIIAAKGSVLEVEHLSTLKNLVSTAFDWQVFIRKNNDFDSLLPEALNWETIESLNLKLHTLVDDEGRIKDSASPVLKKVRKELAGQDSRIRKTLHKIYDDLQKDGLIPDGSSVAVRNGRMVIPVKSEYKKRVDGYVQDESASGNITYIEPPAVVEASNKLAGLKQEERREIFRLLEQISQRCYSENPAIQQVANWVGQLEFLQAKSAFAEKYSLTIPGIVKEGSSIRLVDAFHFGLWKSNQNEDRITVPLSLELDSKNRIVVISGPNAGGKSVALKTIGLAQLMFQYGIPVKASEGTEMKVFQSIFIDIGDNQSIENDLSTYSSHLLLMKRSLENANPGTLVLFDEFGSGTEPRIGGAIAEVVLRELNALRCYGVVTTHYLNIKEFAEREEGILNANMQFDVNEMEPLYKFQIGKAGSSFAIEIARKSGIPQLILEKASEISGIDLVELEVMLARVQQQSKELEDKEIEIQTLKDKLETERRQYIELKHTLDSRKKEILSKATKEAEWILEDANREIEKTIRHIKTSKAHREETKKVRSKLEKKKESIHKKSQEAEGKMRQKKVEQFAQGDRVKVIGQDSSGVIRKIGKKDAEIQFGSLTLRVSVNKLEKVHESEVEKKQQSISRKKGIDITGRKARFNTELNIRGLRGEEAILNLEKFLDDAILLGSSDLRVLHGKGDGILRNLVHNALRKHPSVERYHEEHPERGGAGVTAVFLK